MRPGPASRLLCHMCWSKALFAEQPDPAILGLPN